jgi:hypothetical protein
MVNKPVPILLDEAQEPTDAIIEDALGPAYPAWEKLTAALTGPEFHLKLGWVFYSDGGWLCKALKGSKNQAWLGVWEGYASVAYYFAARHRADLANLAIPQELQDRAAQAALIGKMLPLMIELRTTPDTDAALEVMRYRVKAK